MLRSCRKVNIKPTIQVQNLDSAFSLGKMNFKQSLPKMIQVWRLGPGNHFKLLVFYRVAHCLQKKYKGCIRVNKSGTECQRKRYANYLTVWGLVYSV